MRHASWHYLDTMSMLDCSHLFVAKLLGVPFQRLRSVGQVVQSVSASVNLVAVVHHRLRFHVANHVNHRGEA